MQTTSNRLMRYLIISVFIILPAFSFSQPAKEVLGTFSIGCKIFNYSLKNTPSGIYVFRLENLDNDGSLINFEKLGLKELSTNLSLIRDTLFTEYTTLMDSPASKPLRARIDALNFYTSFIEKIISDSAGLAFWYDNRVIIKQTVAKITPAELRFRDADSLMRKFNQRVSEVLPQVVSTMETRTYSLNQFEEDSFVPLLSHLIGKEKYLFLSECGSDTLVQKKALSVFYGIKAKLDFADDQPVTAYLKLKAQRINIYFTKNRRLDIGSDTSDRLIENKLTVQNVRAEFSDGDIKNLIVDLLFDDVDSIHRGLSIPVRFKNVYPISISSRNDPDEFDKTKIFVGIRRDLNSRYNLRPTSAKTYVFTEHATGYNRNSMPSEKSRMPAASSVTTTVSDDEETDPTDSTRTPKKTDGYYFILSDLLEYHIVATNDNEDYSPANGTVDLNMANPVQELKKEFRSKILTLRTFTDLVGVKGDQPNGLIQVEASRRFNLLTRRHGSEKINFGFWSYFEPILSFSKIEKNNNLVPLSFSSIDSMQWRKTGMKVLNVPKLTLFKYNNSFFEVNTNLFRFHIPSLKSNFQFNFNVGLLRTILVDSLEMVSEGSAIGKSLVLNASPSEEILNSLRYGPSILYEIKPDGRYGISFGYDYRYFDLLSKKFRAPDKSVKGINTIWADAFYDTNETSKLFFRYRISFTGNHTAENFVQIQLGFLLNLFKTAPVPGKNKTL